MDRILILSNERAATELAYVLRRASIDADVIDNPDTLRDELDRGGVEVVVLDLDGRAPRTLDLARELRAAHPATRVVLTGTSFLTERQLERTDCGAAGFLPKPFDLDGAAEFMRDQLATSTHLRRLWHAEQAPSYAC